MAVALADRIYILRMLSETSQSGAPGLFHAWVKNTPVLLGGFREGAGEEQGKGEGKLLKKGKKRGGKREPSTLRELLPVEFTPQTN